MKAPHAGGPRYGAPSKLARECSLAAWAHRALPARRVDRRFDGDFVHRRVAGAGLPIRRCRAGRLGAALRRVYLRRTWARAQQHERPRRIGKLVVGNGPIPFGGSSSTDVRDIEDVFVSSYMTSGARGLTGGKAYAVSARTRTGRNHSHHRQFGFRLRRRRRSRAQDPSVPVTLSEVEGQQRRAVSEAKCRQLQRSPEFR